MVDRRLLFLLAIIFFLGSATTTPAQKPCGWNEEHLFVIPGTISDEEAQAVDKLLEALEDAVGGAVPQIAAVKKAIEELGPGKDVVDVKVIYKCIDNSGKIHR